MKLCFQDKTLRLSSNQDLILYEGDSNFNAQPVKISVNKHARWPHFLLHFFYVHIMNVNYAKFQKRFDHIEQFQGNYLNKLTFL